MTPPHRSENRTQTQIQIDTAAYQATVNLTGYVSGVAAGTYQLTFNAAQRANFQASRQDFRVLHHPIGTFGRKRQGIRAGNLHAVLASATVNARAAWTTARCRRNSAEACKSEFASTPCDTSAAAF